MVHFIKVKYYYIITKILLIFIILYIYFSKKFFVFSYIKNKIFLCEQNVYFKKFYILREKEIDFNNTLILKEKNNILKLFSKTIKKKILKVDTIFYTNTNHFGNLLVNLNKMIYYCEIIGCKNIILDKKVFWFLNKPIFIDKYNISIKIGDINTLYNKSYIYYNSPNLFYIFFNLKPKIKINLMKNDVINNLPKIYSSEKYLYIHIRSGIIFTTQPHIFYAQPPLCFYKNIINNFKFEKIYLIANDKNNPVIQKLFNYYPYIIYTTNSLKEDISYLINAYNIVASISSFLMSIIQLNYNLKFIWDYSIYRMTDKILHYHYDFYKYPNNNFTIYRMQPSSKYRNIMYYWKNTKRQRKLLLKEKCLNEFSIINRNY